MNKNYNDCDIVFELLPLYIEQKTGEESNSFVGAHLAECEACQEIYQLMSADLMMKDTVPCKSFDEQKGKGKKHKGWRLNPTVKKVIILALVLLGYLCLMVGVVVYAFWRLV